jgi:hypothetical protein
MKINKSLMLLYRTMKKIFNKENKLPIALIITLLFCAPCHAQINVNTLASAIRKAENNPNYGVLSIKCNNEAQCRQICINSINHNISRFKRNRALKLTPEAFIAFMGRRWAPVGVKNDPHGLNKNWTKNVLFFYNKLNKNS